jgi:two-component system, LytTR family, sensor kinase
MANELDQPTEPAPSHVAAWWAFGFAVWTLLALMSVLQAAMYLGYVGEPIRWGFLVGVRMLDWYTCALFLPALVWLARRFPLGGPDTPRNVAVQLTTPILFVVLKYALLLPIEHRLGRPDSLTLSGVLAANAVTELMIFWAASAAIHGVEFYRRLRARERQALILEQRLTRARLDALTAQIRPHFLFNTLNSITTLIRRDPEGAERMVMQLADLLSATLRSPEEQEISLHEEMVLLDSYLSIMQVRFGSRLSVERDVSPSATGALVPAFILQPLVENALEHGIARRPGPGRIRIAAFRNNGSLELLVGDDGPGIVGEGGPGINDSPSSGTSGIGLSNTRKRLAELYSGGATLTIDSRAGEGTDVRIAIPFRANTDAARGKTVV